MRKLWGKTRKPELPKCEVCHSEYEPKVEKTIWFRNPNTSGIHGRDVLNCPQCGCQIVLGWRYPDNDEYQEMRGGDEV